MAHYYNRVEDAGLQKAMRQSATVERRRLRAQQAELERRNLLPIPKEQVAPKPSTGEPIAASDLPTTDELVGAVATEHMDTDIGAPLSNPQVVAAPESSISPAAPAAVDRPEPEAVDVAAEAELASLKLKYKDVCGKAPRGIKANDADWLRVQIQKVKEEAAAKAVAAKDKTAKAAAKAVAVEEAAARANAAKAKAAKAAAKAPAEEEAAASMDNPIGALGERLCAKMESAVGLVSTKAVDVPAEAELASLKLKYTEVCGKVPRGIKANDADWLRVLIQKVKEEAVTKAVAAKDKAAKANAEKVKAVKAAAEEEAAAKAAAKAPAKAPAE
jgi:hypothetical protein